MSFHYSRKSAVHTVRQVLAPAGRLFSAATVETAPDGRELGRHATTTIAQPPFTSADVRTVVTGDDRVIDDDDACAMYRLLVAITRGAARSPAGPANFAKRVLEAVLYIIEQEGADPFEVGARAKSSPPSRSGFVALALPVQQFERPRAGQACLATLRATPEFRSG